MGSIPLGIDDVDQESLYNNNEILLLDEDKTHEVYEVLLQALWDCVTKENS